MGLFGDGTGFVPVDGGGYDLAAPTDIIEPLAPLYQDRTGPLRAAPRPGAAPVPPPARATVPPSPERPLGGGIVANAPKLPRAAAPSEPPTAVPLAAPVGGPAAIRELDPDPVAPVAPRRTLYYVLGGFTLLALLLFVFRERR